MTKYTKRYTKAFHCELNTIDLVNQNDYFGKIYRLKLKTVILWHIEHNKW